MLPDYDIKLKIMLFYKMKGVEAKNVVNRENYYVFCLGDKAQNVLCLVINLKILLV